MDLKFVKTEKILFLDIETVSEFESSDKLSDLGQKLWEKKSKQLDQDSDPASNYQKAGLFAEFGKVICISVGFIHGSGSEAELRIKSYADPDEKVLLESFSRMLSKYYSKSEQYLCAHNGKGFDFPFLCRRMLIHQIDIPGILDSTAKKPWETNFIDTMDLWKFGEWRAPVSLETLAWLFKIPTPKDDIDGSQVGEVYWKDRDLNRIVEYCNKDVVTLAQVLLKFKKEPLIQEESIKFLASS